MSVPQRYLFADGELDGVVCQECGEPVVALPPTTNDDGDWVQVAVCPFCEVTPETGVWVPAAARTRRQ